MVCVQNIIDDPLMRNSAILVYANKQDMVRDAELCLFLHCLWHSLWPSLVFSLPGFQSLSFVVSPAFCFFPVLVHWVVDTGLLCGPAANCVLLAFELYLLLFVTAIAAFCFAPFLGFLLSVQKGCLTTAEVCEALALPELRGRRWHVQASIAIRCSLPCSGKAFQ